MKSKLEVFLPLVILLLLAIQQTFVALAQELDREGWATTSPVCPPAPTWADRPEDVLYVPPEIPSKPVSCGDSFPASSVIQVSGVYTFTDATLTLIANAPRGDWRWGFHLPDERMGLEVHFPSPVGKMNLAFEGRGIGEGFTVVAQLERRIVVWLYDTAGERFVPVVSLTGRLLSITDQKGTRYDPWATLRQEGKENYLDPGETQTFEWTLNGPKGSRK